MVCVMNVQSEDTKHKQGKLLVRVTILQNVPIAMLGIPNQALGVHRPDVPAMAVQLVTNPKQENLVKFVRKDTMETNMVNNTAKCVLMENMQTKQH